MNIFNLKKKKTGQHWFKLQRESDGSWDFPPVFFLLEKFAIVAIFLKSMPRVQRSTKEFFGKYAPKSPCFEEKKSEAIIFRQYIHQNKAEF